MQQIDQRAISVFGIPSLLLMENAGRGIAEFIYKTYRGKRVTILCGKGNNGGDGFVVARHLHNHGFSVYVLLAEKPDTLKADASINFKIVKNMKIAFSVLEDSETLRGLGDVIRKSDMVIDALFGVGLERPIEGIYRTIIEAINANAKTVIAVDISSGLNADTGKIMGVAVKASATATLGLPKQGLFLGEGPEYSGKIAVIDIGLPKELR